VPWIGIVTDVPLGIPMGCGAVNGANAGGLARRQFLLDLERSTM
jgi:hypothetical protein